jgi:hypothetical protein
MKPESINRNRFLSCSHKLKKMMGDLILKIIKLLVSIVMAIIAISVFVCFYNYIGIHTQNPTGATDYVWRPNGLMTTMKEGFAWFQLDSNGFHNRSAQNDIDILLMGSSHMEAVQMDVADTVGDQLGQLTNKKVYNIGLSAHDFYRCVDNISDALNEYAPSEYVIIETGSIQLDPEEITAVLNHTATPVPSYDHGLIYYLQLCPAFKPIYQQIDNWMQNDRSRRMMNAAEHSDGNENNKIDDNYKEILYEFLSIVSDKAHKANVQPIIFYHPSEKLNSDGTVTYLTEANYLDLFSDTCNKLGITFVDATGSFQQLYSERHQLAHGFINTGIGVGHLNKYGHHVIAEKLAEVINGPEVD